MRPLSLQFPRDLTPEGIAKWVVASLREVELASHQLDDRLRWGAGENLSMFHNEVYIASATTCDVLGANGLAVQITGTVTITSLGTGPNRIQFVRFAGALTLTHNAASLILPAANNILTAAGDTMIVISDESSNARVVNYQRADGTALSMPDYYLEIAKGNVAGHSLIHKFGRNAAVASGSWELVSLLSGATSFLSAATTVRVKAGGHINDTAGGSAAQGVTIEGLDETGAFATETVATAGASASTSTTTTFIRVFRAYVSTVGTYGGSNTTAVTIEKTAGGDLIQIAVLMGQTEYAAYTIPLGKTGYLTSIVVQADTNKTTDFRLIERRDILDTSDPMSPARLKFFWDGVLGGATLKPKSPILTLPALTDIWVEASGSGAMTEASADFEIILVDN